MALRSLWGRAEWNEAWLWHTSGVPAPAVLRLDDLQQHPLIQRLLKPNIHRRTKDYGRVSQDKLDRLEADYAPIFQDRVEFLRARRYIAELTRDKQANPVRLELRASRLRMLAGDPPASDLDEAVAWLLDTRRTRWERLALQLGVAFPDRFQVYRGVGGQESVGAVLGHWMGAQNAREFPVLQYSTASWSLSPATGTKFMGSGPDAVLYRADVDFDSTFADMLVDDGSFVVPYQNQWEVVAGPLEPEGALFADVAATTVRFQGKVYTHGERELLREHWSQGGSPPTLRAGGDP